MKDSWINKKGFFYKILRDRRFWRTSELKKVLFVRAENLRGMFWLGDKTEWSYILNTITETNNDTNPSIKLAMIAGDTSYDSRWFKQPIKRLITITIPEDNFLRTYTSLANFCIKFRFDKVGRPILFFLLVMFLKRPRFIQNFLSVSR